MLTVELLGKKNRGVKNSSPEQCYGCNKFFVQRKNEKHLENCCSKPGVLYKFNNQNVQTFEDNFRFMGEVPFSVYFDFESV